MTDTYLDAVFRYVTGIVPLRLLTEKGLPPGPAWSEYHSLGPDLAARVQKAAKKAHANQRALYIIPGSVERPGSAMATDIIQTPVLLIDIDQGDIVTIQAHLVRHLGLPTLEVASGGTTAEGQEKRHLYWRLTEPASGEDIKVVEGLRKAIAAKVGGDPSFGSIHQPIRVAGSVHQKYGRKALVRIVAQTEREYDLLDLGGLVDQMPAITGVNHRLSIATHDRTGPSVAELMTRPIREGGVDGTTRFGAHSSVMGHWIRQVRSGFATLDDAWTAVCEYNAAMIVPPWEEDLVRREFDALWRLDIRKNGPMPVYLTPGRIAADGSPAIAPDSSEDALADAFVEQHGEDWRFVPAFGAWMHWTGFHWERDTLVAVREAVRLVCRTYAVERGKPSDARRIASDKTIASVIRLASSDPAIASPAEAWDADLMLLNTPTGIVDLATGEIKPHDRAYLMTQMSGASVGSACPSWESFLLEVCDNDEDMVAYLQRVCGYCLTGLTRDQVFFFLHGDGANGKSVFLRTLSTVLGTYATTAPLETFTASQGDRHPTDLAGLRGARLVAVAETDAGRFWAETRIKTITGGDPIKARFMHRDFFEFRPTFKLMVAGNHRPRLKGVGEAMRRRLHFVPFTVTIPEEKRDKTLEAQLIAEQDGILSWMLQGCAEWQRIGLSPPEKVRAASDEYFGDEDVVGQWIATQCSVDKTFSESTAALFHSWSLYAEAAGLERGSSQTFVSVTQSFNTTTFMGRLTLNILLSFAQFEREVTGERIRDKIAASRRKGMWMGGVPPLGYVVQDRRLVENPGDAAHVRWVFARFIEIGSGTELARELAARGVTTRHGHLIDKKFIYRMLNNRVYIGEAVHKGISYPGEHKAIIDREVWNKVHTILTESPRKRAANTRADTPALLKGLLYGPDGAAFSPTHTRKGGRLYRYYVSQTVLKHGAGSCPFGRVSAGEIETAVIDQLRAVFRQPEIVAGTWKAARAQDGEITEADARDALTRLDPLWDELFPAEQARIATLLVERIDIGTDGLDVRLRMDGLTGLAREMMADLGTAA